MYSAAWTNPQSSVLIRKLRQQPFHNRIKIDQNWLHIESSSLGCRLPSIQAGSLPGMRTPPAPEAGSQGANHMDREGGLEPPTFTFER